MKEKDYETAVGLTWDMLYNLEALMGSFDNQYRNKDDYKELCAELTESLKELQAVILDNKPSK